VNGATRKDLVGAGIALLLALGCVRLGIWQVHRLAQRKARNAAQLARWKLPALTIASRGLPRTPPISAGSRPRGSGTTSTSGSGGPVPGKGPPAWTW